MLSNEGLRQSLKTNIESIVGGVGSWGRIKQSVNLVLRVDPSVVDSYVQKFPMIGTKRRQVQYFLLRQRHPFVVYGDDFPHPRPVTEIPKYFLMADALRNLGDITKSMYFEKGSCEFNEHGETTFQHMRIKSQNQIAETIDTYVRELADSFRRHGYRDDVSSDIGLAAIGPHGELLKSGCGHHRSTIARELGIERVPLEVHFVHEASAYKNGYSTNLKGFGSLDNLRSGLASVEKAHCRQR